MREKRGEEEWRREDERRLQALEETLEEKERVLSGIAFLRGRDGDSWRLGFRSERRSLGRRRIEGERKLAGKFSTKWQGKNSGLQTNMKLKLTLLSLYRANKLAVLFSGLLLL